MGSILYAVQKIIDYIKHNINNIEFFEIEIYPENKIQYLLLLRYMIDGKVYTEKYTFKAYSLSLEEYQDTIRIIEEFLEELEKEIYPTMEKYLIEYIKRKYPGSKILNIYKYEGTVTAEITTADGKFMIIKIIYYSPVKKHYEGIPGIGAIIYLKPTPHIIIENKY